MVNKQQSAPQIEIVKMFIGEYEVLPPPGLSELLNSIGGWGVRPKEPECAKDYTRRIEKRDGKVFTILTKIEKEDAK